MPTTVLALEEYREWFMQLDHGDQDSVLYVVRLLEELGVLLPYPYSSAIAGSRHAVRELRPKQGRSPLRVFYAFDPDRAAILLLGGDKSGDNRFYERVVPRADDLFDAYLAWLATQRK